MSVRNLAAAGLASFAAGGPLLLAASTDLGALALTGIALLWLGLLLMFAAVLQLGRTGHRMLRAQAKATRDLAAQLPARDGNASDERIAAELLERLADVSGVVRGSLDAHRRELLQVVDARVLGIHETVRDLAATDIGASDIAAPDLAAPDLGASDRP